MPVINGRLHLPQQHLTSRQKLAYGVGVGIAVAFIAGSWWVVAGFPNLTTFIAGIGSGVSGVAEQTGVLRAEAIGTSSVGIEAVRSAVTDLLQEAEAKKAAADIVAEQLKSPPPEQSL